MRLRYLPFFLTFVVLTANAAPDSSIVLPQIQTKEVNKSGTKGPTDLDTVQSTTLPELPLRPRKLTELSDASYSLGVGILSGEFDQDEDSQSLSTLHLQRTQYNLDETAQEFGLTLTTNGYFAIDLGFKTFCCFTTMASAFQPFYKFGVVGIYEPKDQLGNLIDYKRYFLQASIGSEDLFFARRALRLETGARYGYPGFHVFAELFYSWPD